MDRRHPIRGHRKKPTLEDGPLPPKDATRLQHVLNVGESVEDFETRAKPPFVSIPGQEAEDRLTPQQKNGLSGIFDQHPDDFRDCILIHQYAEPLEVIDSYEMERQVWARMYRGSEDINDTNASNVTYDPILIRPGAVYDSATDDGNELHVGTSMMAVLEGISNPVQVIATGPVALWSSKERVPIAGFLCMENDKSDSAPILHTTPTPCVPTTLDAQGNGLDPFLDPYEVFIGSTRVAFQNKVQAEKFCLAYAEEIAKDLGTLVWDAEDLKGAMPEPEASHPAIQEEALAVGDVCYRFCEDGSEPSVDLRGRCPVDAPCASPLPSGMMSFDSCGDRAHTCCSVAPQASGTPAFPDAAPAASPSAGPMFEIVVPRRTSAIAADEAQLEDGAAPAPAVTQALLAEAEAVAAASAPAPAALVQTAAAAERSQAAAPRFLRQRQRPRRRRRPADPAVRLAEGRLWMAGGGHEDKVLVHEDKLALGIRALGLVRNPDLLSFIAGTRKRPTPDGWTLGRKSLLVLVMDWKSGDQSLAPYSQQDANSLPLYQQKIFPEVQRKFSQMSYGQFELDITFVPEVVHYTRNRNQLTGRLPFPTLYNEARDALQSHPKFGHKFAFRDYDLVYVIHPQVNPVGTKGVAWVGARGAVCNGCETISDSFKIMVAVHELGHNLGLSHASSEALEYGNPFDWMGNYPDVSGLHYGLGYKSELRWISPENVMDITDANVDSVNDMVTLTPYDLSTKPQPGDVVGVRISLGDNAEDIYVSYRSTLKEGHRGIFIVYQAKDNPNSKLMDAACHSDSQQDAHMREGWTYMDGSHKVIIKVVQQANQYAKVHIYRMPKVAHAVAGIRARSLFTDGQTKCPLTCQDSDLIISKSCADLSNQGFCTGTLKLHGKKLSIGREVCPQTCGKCEEVLSGSPEVGSASVCGDASVMISGMDCPQIAQRDMCQMKTTSGKKLGQDLCRMSCGECPKPPPPSRPDSQANFPDPPPARSAGGGAGGGGSACPAGCGAQMCRAGGAGNGGLELVGGTCAARCSRIFGDIRYCGAGGEYVAAGSLDCSSCGGVQAGAASVFVCPSTCMAPTCSHGSPSNGGLHLSGSRCTGRCSQMFGDQRYCGWGGVYAAEGSVDCSACGPAALRAPLQPASAVASACEDDVTWADPDGHDCEIYRNTIAKWGKDKVCKAYKRGIAGRHCRATCGTCKAETPEPSSCADNACVGPWLEAYGRCFQCGDFLMGCTDPKYKAVFRVECPLTCGVCQRPKSLPASSGNSTSAASENATCEDEEPGFCSDLGNRYCSEGSFSTRCKKTCDLCPPPGAGAQDESCHDRFSSYTCQRYESYGWCAREDTKAMVQMSCPVTCGLCGGWAPLPGLATTSHKPADAVRSAAQHRGGARTFLWVAILVSVVPLVSAQS